ncbi:MAG: ACP S-malonyltransferase [Pseudomonadota bacterium]|nr:ACP S-malonyltransferase [Pseudomonadota bacterium]
MRSLVFPGQGSQYVGMGKDLYDSFPEVKVIFEEVDDALKQKLSDIIFEGPENDLTLTENAQPAIMTIGIAVINILKLRGFIVEKIANISAGHSLGEYTSLTALDSLSLTDAAKLLKLRGKAMQDSFPTGKGAMAAILGLDINDVKEIINTSKTKNVCQVANDNAPGQIVISGEKSSVDYIIDLLKEKGAKKAIKLPVSAPFHCDLMDNAKIVIQNELANINLSKPKIPIVQNTTVSATQDIETIKINLINQVIETVRWRETMEKFTELGVESIIEVGAGNVLSNLAKRSCPNLQRFTLNSKESIENFMREIKIV